MDRSQQRHTAREVASHTNQRVRHTHYPWEVASAEAEAGGGRSHLFPPLASEASVGGGGLGRRPTTEGVVPTNVAQLPRSRITHVGIDAIAGDRILDGSVVSATFGGQRRQNGDDDVSGVGLEELP